MKHSQKLIVVILLAAGGVFWSCNKPDNYPPPNASISGALIDPATNDTVPTSNSSTNGGIYLYQMEYNGNAIDANGRSFVFGYNGTYQNTQVFSGKYKIAPKGAFYYTDTVVVDISGNLHQDLKVTPFAYATIQVKAVTDTSVSYQYSVKNNTLGKQALTSAAVFLGLSPSLDLNQYLNVANNLTTYPKSPYFGNPIAIQSDTLISGTLSSLLPNTVYYLRSGALTDNTSKYWNFSKVVQVKTTGQ